MKLILSAMALVFAVPAAAQTAPEMNHSQHHAAGHQGHGPDGKQECPMSHKGQKMACCEHAKDECPMAKNGKSMACCEHGAHNADGNAHADHGSH